MRTRELGAALLAGALLLVTLVAAAEAQRPGGGGKGRHRGGSERDKAAQEVLGPGEYALDGAQAIQAINRGEGSEALAYYERTGEQAGKEGNQVRAARAWHAATVTALRLGRFQKVIQDGGRAIEMFKAAGGLTPSDLGSWASVHAQLGSAYRAVGDLPRARATLEEGVALIRARMSGRREDQAEGVLLNGLAQVAYAQRDYAAALARSGQAAQFFEGVESGLPPKGQEHLRTKLRRWNAASLSMIGRAQLALGHPDEADQAFDRGLRYARLTGLRDTEAEMLAGQGSLALARQDWPRALGIYQQADRARDAGQAPGTPARALPGPGARADRARPDRGSLRRLARGGAPHRGAPGGPGRLESPHRVLRGQAGHLPARGCARAPGGSSRGRFRDGRAEPIAHVPRPARQPDHAFQGPHPRPGRRGGAPAGPPGRGPRGRGGCGRLRGLGAGSLPGRDARARLPRLPRAGAQGEPGAGLPDGGRAGDAAGDPAPAARGHDAARVPGGRGRGGGVGCGARGVHDGAAARRPGLAPRAGAALPRRDHRPGPARRGRAAGPRAAPPAARAGPRRDPRRPAGDRAARDPALPAVRRAPLAGRPLARGRFRAEHAAERERPPLPGRQGCRRLGPDPRGRQPRPGPGPRAAVGGAGGPDGRPARAGVDGAGPRRRDRSPGQGAARDGGARPPRHPRRAERVRPALLGDLAGAGRGRGRPARGARGLRARSPRAPGGPLRLRDRARPALAWRRAGGPAAGVPLRGHAGGGDHPVEGRRPGELRADPRVLRSPRCGRAGSRAPPGPARDPARVSPSLRLGRLRPDRRLALSGGGPSSVFGAPLPRKEDARLVAGQGRYVTDVELPRMLHVVFVRSPHAHARIRGIDADAARAAAGVAAVAVGADPDVASHRIEARSALPGYVMTGQPILAWPEVRFAGEAVAAVVARDRYAAEDAAALVSVDWDPLPAALDLVDPARTGAVVHEAAPGNVLLARRFESGQVEATLASSAAVIERVFRTNRQTAAPLEGRAGVADWSAGEGKLTLWLGTQVPHLVRHALAEMLALPENRIRVVAPDVGGGFGVKAVLYPEDVALCLLAVRLGRPVKWVEQRREGFLASVHARDHHYAVRAGFDRDGRLLALDARIACNAGAYSVFPWTAGIEALMAGGLLAGPYKVPHYRCEVTAVATHTTPAGPYRGVARPATTFVMERLLDLGTRALGLDPVAVRRVNLIEPADLPYTSATRLVHDCGSYPLCFEKVVEAIDYAAFRAEQARLRREGRYLGIGFANYNELTGLGQAASAGPRMPFRTGHEGATVRMDPSGAVTVLAGVTSQGQGLETTMAQLVAAELGLPLDAVRVIFGDTDATPFGLGAFASRQAVIGGGAVTRAARALRERITAIAAHLLEAAAADLEVAGGRIAVRGMPGRGVSMLDVARVAHLETHRLPPETEPGLEATRFYDPIRGTFAAGAQAAVVEVDVATGRLHIRRYVCVEDTGRVINPLIVEGQVQGAIAQGIGGALLEHLIYDEAGQLLTGTLMEYALPTAADLPAFELAHVEVPAENLLGVRGVGEGGTLGPPAVLANAVSDALAPFGTEVNELPITPARLWARGRAAPQR